MIPGFVSKLSEEDLVAAATISPQKELVFITGTTAIATIKVPPLGGFSGILYLVALDAAGVATLTSGNIALAVSLTTGVVTPFVFSKSHAKWYPGAIS